MRQTKRNGTILIELIVCIFLVGITAVALYSALLVGGRLNQRARNLTRGAEIATQAMEVVEGMDYADLTVPYNGSFFGDVDPVTDLPDGTGNLTISWHNSPTNTIKRAVVTVTWDERGQTEQISYSTLLTSYE